MDQTTLTRLTGRGPRRMLERLGFLHMALQDSLGTGYSSAIKVIS
jgi:hypothetical protein